MPFYRQLLILLWNVISYTCAKSPLRFIYERSSVTILSRSTSQSILFVHNLLKLPQTLVPTQPKIRAYDATFQFRRLRFFLIF